MERVLRAAGHRRRADAPPTAAAIFKRDRERLLNDPVFDTEPNAEELPSPQDLLALRSPEQIAAAYLSRQNHVKRPTPEELVDTGPAAERSEPRAQRLRWRRMVQDIGRAQAEGRAAMAVCH